MVISSCGGFFNEHLIRAVRDGAVPGSSVIRAARRLLQVQMRLGMFDDDASQPFRQLGRADVNTESHRALALSAARQGVVLLSNKQGLLPLSRATVGDIALVGPHWNATTALQGNYAGGAPYLVSPFAGLRRILGPAHAISVAPGCGISGLNATGIAAAVRVASAAQTTIVAVGLDGTQEGEAHDRVSIDLPGLQAKLIAAVASAAAQNGGRVIVVVITGGPVDLAAVKANAAVDAILSAGYGGQSGGDAIADVLFGEHTPAGRLTTTWPSRSQAAACDILDFSMRPGPRCPIGRGYRFFTGEPVFAFGAGLSYSAFNVSVRAASATVPHAEVQRKIEEGDVSAVATVVFAVRNHGPRDGGYTAMVLVRTPAGVDPQLPTTQLRHFSGRVLRVGEEATLSFGLAASDFSVVTPAGNRSTLRGDWVVELARGGGGVGAPWPRQVVTIG